MEDFGIVPFPQPPKASLDLGSLAPDGFIEAVAHGCGGGDPPGNDPAQVPAQPGDLHVEEGIPHLGAAAPYGGGQAPLEPRRGPRRMRHLRREDGQAHVEVPALAGGADQIPHPFLGSADALALRLFGEVQQRAAQPSARHAHVVHGLGISADRFRKVLEQLPYPLPQQVAGSWVARWRSHRKVVELGQTNIEIEDPSGWPDVV